MASGIPSVESGTAGYLGQVQPLLKVRLYIPNVCMFLRVHLLENTICDHYPVIMSGNVLRHREISLTAQERSMARPPRSQSFSALRC